MNIDALRALSVLLDELSDAISRHDGEAAVDTMARIRVVAGPAFTDRLLWHLITAGLRRAATQPPTTRCCGEDRTATGH